MVWDQVETDWIDCRLVRVSVSVGDLKILQTVSDTPVNVPRQEMKQHNKWEEPFFKLVLSFKTYTMVQMLGIGVVAVLTILI